MCRLNLIFFKNLTQYPWRIVKERHVDSGEDSKNHYIFEDKRGDIYFIFDWLWRIVQRNIRRNLGYFFQVLRTTNGYFKGVILVIISAKSAQDGILCLFYTLGRAFLSLFDPNEKEVTENLSLLPWLMWTAWVARFSPLYIKQKWDYLSVVPMVGCSSRQSFYESQGVSFLNFDSVFYFLMAINILGWSASDRYWHRKRRIS